jgi:hypothetical protein
MLFKKPNPYPKSCTNEAIIDKNPIFMLLFFRVESKKIVKNNEAGNHKTIGLKKLKGNSKIAPKTKIEGKK